MLAAELPGLEALRLDPRHLRIVERIGVGMRHLRPRRTTYDDPTRAPFRTSRWWPGPTRPKLAAAPRAAELDSP